MSYKRFLTEGITCYNGQWYCYRCKVTLQNRTEAQCHLEGPHPLSSTLICQFLQKSVKLTNKKCKKLLRHGIIIRDLDIELDYFCVHCQVPIPLECCSHHFNEENHQKHLNMSEHLSEQQSSDDNNTNNEKNNSPVENSTKRTTESNLSVDTQPIREKFTKDFFVNTNTNKLEKSAGKQQNLNKNTIDNKNKTKSNLSAEIQPIREKLTKDSFANFNINGLKKPADKQRNLNNNTIANQNVPVDVSPDGNDLNRDLPSNFTAEEKSTVPLKSCNDSTQMVNKTIADMPYALIQEAEMSKHFLMQHAIRYGPWYCHVCKCMLYSLTDVDRHLQEGHRNSGAQTPDFLDRSTESSNCTDLLNHEIIMQDKPQDYFCVPCRCSLPSLDHFYEHSLGKKHMRMLNCNTKLINTNINNNGLEKPTDKQRNNKIHINDNENIPVDALPVGNNGLEKPADKQRNNKIHINDNQNISVDVLPDGNNGLEKPADKQRNSNNNTIENVPVDALPDGNNGLEKPANKQRNSNNKTIENASVDVLSDENNSIRNLPSSFTAEKKSTVSSKSCNKNGINILQTYKYVETAFCYLCDMFVYKTTVRNHMRESVHNYVASMLNVSNPVSHIIKLEGKKNIVTALQLNSKKFDGTVWPEYADTDAAKYTCDQCNKMIEEKDIINHEVTVHKSNMVTSMRFIHDWSPEIKNLNVTGICYPLFKCSFCNEIIHGILSLELHFSKCEHKENIKLLIDIKRREYDDSCENIQIYLEPLEFLSLISFENNGGTVRIQEQPVMYVKNHYTTLREKVPKKFTYICFDCRLRFYEIHDAIIHLCTLTHLRQYKNIFHTYNYVHDVSASGELNVNESEREVKSPVSRKDVSIGNASLKKRKDDEMQVNTRQHLNLKAEVATASSKNGGSRQNEENNSGFFMSLDVFMEIDALIKKFIPNQGTHVDFNKGSALERYNKSYEKEFLDFEEIMFTCNERKLKEIKLNLRFIHPQNLDKMLCLICNDSLLCDVQAIYEHINSKEHVTKFVKLYNDKEEFELLLDLIKPAYYQYAMCFACNTHILGRSNVDYKNHTDCSAHKKNRQRLLGQVESVLKKFENLWYSIQYFTCVDCSMRFKMKIQFMEHLNAAHRAVLTTKSNSMFDFCLTCATLWYKNESNSKDVRKSYENHCQQRMHLYLRQNNDFAITPLPQPLQKLLRDVNGIAANLFKLSNDASNDPKVTRFMDDLKRIFKTHRLPVKVYMFGSRVTGLASTNSDIDVYLNFGDGYTGPESIKRRSKQIQDCLRTDHENWDIELTLAKSRTPIIKVKHRSTGLQCDISFTSGLSVENSKFIRSFNIAYPPCQKLILFLRKWLLLGGLTGTVGIHGISNYALVWLVIFYLQVKLKKIPSIATLIQNHKQSKIVSGWEVGVSDTIFIKEPEHPIHELLLGFFEFYGNFDYMHFVVCPLLGKVCQKTAFAEVSTLPDSMARYVEQLKIKKPEYFRVDSSMCVQDPFDLSHNLTKAVSISTLKRFKHYCNESFSATKVY